MCAVVTGVQTCALPIYMRNKIVAGNWKMNLDYQEGISLFSEILNMVGDETRGNQQVIVCSPFIHLYNIAQQSKDAKNVFVGAQNIHQNDSGAYTGETSASQVKSTGASYRSEEHTSELPSLMRISYA